MTTTDRLGDATPAHASLTSREQDVFAHLSRGETTAAIAGHMGLAVKTVEGYYHSLYHKLGMTGSEHLRWAAARWGLRQEWATAQRQAPTTDTGACPETLVTTPHCMACKQALDKVGVMQDRDNVIALFFCTGCGATFGGQALAVPRQIEEP